MIIFFVIIFFILFLLLHPFFVPSVGTDKDKYFDILSCYSLGGCGFSLFSLRDVKHLIVVSLCPFMRNKPQSPRMVRPVLILDRTRRTLGPPLPRTAARFIRLRFWKRKRGLKPRGHIVASFLLLTLPGLALI